MAKINRLIFFKYRKSHTHTHTHTHPVPDFRFLVQHRSVEAAAPVLTSKNLHKLKNQQLLLDLRKK